MCCTGEAASDDVDQLMAGSNSMQGLLLVGDLGVGKSPRVNDQAIKLQHKAPSWGVVMLNVPPSV